MSEKLIASSSVILFTYCIASLTLRLRSADNTVLSLLMEAYSWCFDLVFEFSLQIKGSANEKQIR